MTKWPQCLKGRTSPFYLPSVPIPRYLLPVHDGKFTSSALVSSPPDHGAAPLKTKCNQAQADHV